MKTAQEIKYLQDQYHTGENEAERVVAEIERYIHTTNKRYINFPHIGKQAIDVLHKHGFIVEYMKDKEENSWITIKW